MFRMYKLKMKVKFYVADDDEQKAKQKFVAYILKQTNDIYSQFWSNAIKVKKVKS